MNRRELIDRLRSLSLPKEEYWLIAGGAMVLYGVRAQTHDIDLGCSRALADRLEAEGYPAERMKNGHRRFLLGADVEIFEAWLYDRVETLDGLPVISLDGLVQMKQSLGREKDLRDLAAIREYRKRQSVCNQNRSTP